MLTSNFMVNWDGFDYGTLRPMWPLWYRHTTIDRGRYTEEQRRGQHEVPCQHAGIMIPSFIEGRSRESTRDSK